MKNLIFCLSIGFLLSLADLAHAGSNTLIASYPAVSGSYNQVSLQSPSGYTISQNECNDPNNNGELYYDPNGNGPGNGALVLCATNTVSGHLTEEPVAYNETCFNRYCSVPSDPTGCVNFSTTPPPSSNCPAGYAQANMGGTWYDSFNPIPAVTVYSITCCTSGLNSVVNQTS